MNIKPAKEIRENYDRIAEECRESGEPVILTKNGRAELVAMDVASYERRQQELVARMLVLESYADVLAGAHLYTQKEVEEELDKVIAEA